MARVLSVNVGLPKDVAWHRQTVYTGIWKRAVAGPQRVRTLNIDGDGQGDLAGHGGEHRAVLAYQIESYRYWEQHFGRDDFAYGQFGENLTVDGLADDEVCVGDRYRIGTAEFEVTQPRVTCYRVGLRMGEPQMAALLVAHHRPGFYLRVLAEGQVQAGDEIVKIASGAESMTVAEIDALLYLPGRERDQLVRAVRIDALSDGWRRSFQELLDGIAEQEAAWPGFRPLTVVGTESESLTIPSIRLAAPDGAPLPTAKPGQFLTVRLPTRGGAPPRIRSYSLSSRPGASEYRIGVKREPGGEVSGYLHTELAVGHSLDVAAPRGDFILDNSDSPVVLLSAGVGVTPLMAMLHTLAADRREREVWWLHGARCADEQAFADEVQALLGRLPHAHGYVYYSAPRPNDRLGRDYTAAGRLTTSTLAHFGLPRDAQAYLCGPAPFMQQIRDGLAELGVAAQQIHTEIFGAVPAITPGIASAPAVAPHQPSGVPGDGPAVSFARSGISTTWSDRYVSVLELAEACDVPTRWACRTGVCHTCQTTVMSGQTRYTPDPLEPPPDGSALICCSRPTTDVVLDL